MCLIVCKWCGEGLGSFPCMFHQYPDKFKKLHPRLFIKYVKLQEQIKKQHKCKNEDLKWSVDFWKAECKRLENELDKVKK